MSIDHDNGAVYVAQNHFFRGVVPTVAALSMGIALVSAWTASEAQLLTFTVSTSPAQGGEDIYIETSAFIGVDTATPDASRFDASEIVQFEGFATGTGEKYDILAAIELGLVTNGELLGLEEGDGIWYLDLGSSNLLTLTDQIDPASLESLSLGTLRDNPNPELSGNYDYMYVEGGETLERNVGGYTITMDEEPISDPDPENPARPILQEITLGDPNAGSTAMAIADACYAGVLEAQESGVLLDSSAHNERICACLSLGNQTLQGVRLRRRCPNNSSRQ